MSGMRSHIHWNYGPKHAEGTNESKQDALKWLLHRAWSKPDFRGTRATYWKFAIHFQRRFKEQNPNHFIGIALTLLAACLRANPFRSAEDISVCFKSRKKADCETFALPRWNLDKSNSERRWIMGKKNNYPVWQTKKIGGKKINKIDIRHFSKIFQQSIKSL